MQKALPFYVKKKKSPIHPDSQTARSYKAKSLGCKEWKSEAKKIIYCFFKGIYCLAGSFSASLDYKARCSDALLQQRACCWFCKSVGAWNASQCLGMSLGVVCAVIGSAEGSWVKQCRYIAQCSKAPGFRTDLYRLWSRLGGPVILQRRWRITHPLVGRRLIWRGGFTYFPALFDSHTEGSFILHTRRARPRRKRQSTIMKKCPWV